MTRAEIRIEAAKKRERQAKEALSRAYEAKRAAVKAATSKHLPRVWAAEKKFCEARAASTMAEMAAYGIAPMETIIECTPAMDKRRGRYAVKITREGWPRLVPVGKSGKVLAGRGDRQSPWRWSDATVTGEKVTT
ncbi:hypothetical protein [Thauera sp.]|uniref:hypothetical protein n=1 Tax=Thauera sp. TaxID=1905334 RepID=UPI002BD1D997|nr:hypothetical protein [Thauera sp.]HRP26380.1 hypothetical protein [Thauera sp.]